MTTTLLAIDDSKTIRRVLEITFAGENYRTVLADSADDAMNKLRSERPSVALVDASLGSSSGYDLCQQIKREAPGVTVIVLSSKQAPYDRARGSSARVDSDNRSTRRSNRQVNSAAAGKPRRRHEAQPAPARRDPGFAARAAHAPWNQRRGTYAPARLNHGVGMASARGFRHSHARPTVLGGAARDSVGVRQRGGRAHSTSLGSKPLARSRPQRRVRRGPSFLRRARVEPAPAAGPRGGGAPSAPAPAVATATPWWSVRPAPRRSRSHEQQARASRLSRDASKSVWKVVAGVAETLIKEEIRRLTID